MNNAPAFHTIPYVVPLRGDAGALLCCSPRRLPYAPPRFVDVLNARCYGSALRMPAAYCVCVAVCTLRKRALAVPALLFASALDAAPGMRGTSRSGGNIWLNVVCDHAVHGCFLPQQRVPVCCCDICRLSRLLRPCTFGGVTMDSTFTCLYDVAQRLLINMVYTYWRRFIARRALGRRFAAQPVCRNAAYYRSAASGFFFFVPGPLLFATQPPPS